MFNTQAKAKLVKNSKLKLYKLVVAFNVYEKRAQFSEDNLVYKFPIQKQCDYVSGDITLEQVADTIAQAERALGTNNIVLVA